MESVSSVAQGTRIVEVDRVTVKYGARTALDNVSLIIEEGVVGLLGPNGAGKSTLLKTLLGFCRPLSGTATLFGRPVGTGDRDLRALIGYMPEKDVSSPKLSAVSFVSYCGTLAGMPYKDALQRTHEVLNYVGFGEERYRAMETYSTGMRQRAKLAQALVHDPRLLFLDEPTNGLDPLGRVAMLDLIREIARMKQVGIILSSHLLPDVEHVCERVVLINHGRVVQQGMVSELTRREQHRFAVRVKEDGEGFARQLQERGYTVEFTEDGKILIELSNDSGPGDLFRIAQQCGAQIRHLEPVRQQLEEVFLQAVGGETQIT